MITICPLCGSGETRRAFQARDEHHGSPGLWWLRTCIACESLFLEDPPDPETLVRLHPPETYYAYRARPEGVSRRLKDFLQRIVGFSRLPGQPAMKAGAAGPVRILDFGCGAGDYLAAMRSKGMVASGVEISDAGRQAAISRGFDVRPTVTGLRGFGEESFDFVRANHSLEHVPDPAETVRELTSVLSPDGTIFIAVPNAASMNARLFGPSWWHLTAPLHVTIPSPAGIAALLEGAGLDLLECRTRSDFAGIAGSLQIILNRGRRLAGDGVLMRSLFFKPVLVLAQWTARLQDLFGRGDILEVVARQAPPRSEDSRRDL